MADFDWIKEVPYEDLLHGDPQLIYEHCGLETLLMLWTALPGITLYLSERPLNEIRKRYIRKTFNRADPACTAKALAAKLGVSERFVYETLAAADAPADPRQAKLFDRDR